MGDELKNCVKCGEDKPIEEFRLKSKTSAVRRSSCAGCEKKYRKEWLLAGGTKKPETPKFSNSLLFRNPSLAKELSPKNSLSADKIPYRSSYIALWVCEEGHEWEGSVDKRAGGGIPCSECALKSKALHTIDGISDWLTNLDSDMKAKSIETLSTFMKGSTRKVTLACPECGHIIVTPIQSFNRRCPKCSIRKASLQTHLPEKFLMEFDFEKNSNKPDEISYNSSQLVHWKCEKDHEWSTPAYQRVNHMTGCPDCSRYIKVSRPESSLIEWLKTVIGEDRMILNSRNIIKPYELDIYIPSKKVAIEFNGLYWHSERKGKHRNYHRDKWSACKEQNIQLIQIWSDDWDRNPNAVKKAILHKIGESTEQRIYARLTKPQEITKDEAEEFLNSNHIQGYSSGSSYIALKLEDRNIAVMVLKQSTTDGLYNIVRYATSSNVVGGFTKLLKYAEFLLTPKGFVTFSDNTISNGNLYKANGFVEDRELRPDYSYIVNKQRRHKFSYRLKRFRNDPKLIWKEGLSESELAKINKLDKVWDAGKIRWIKIL